MGRPLAHVPDQAGTATPSTPATSARCSSTRSPGLGIVPDRYYWMSDIYPTGQMDPYIRTALDRAETVREVYRRVANVQHPDHWLPVGVICPNCGKVGTTIASDWDGETVSVACKPDLVDVGDRLRLDRAGRPFGGNAKLPWNLEWAAQWSLFGVTIEPNGKDLATAGGSRDRSNAIAREVFEREPPRNFPYEFLNIGGRKMSTSKGRGAAAHTIASVIPPEQLRFLFVRPAPGERARLRPRGHRRDPAPVRRVRPARAPPRPGARSRASCRRATSRSSATRCSIPTRTSRPRPPLPARVRPPRAARPDPGHRRPGAGRGGEGERPDRGRVGASSRCASPRSAAGWRRTRRSGHHRDQARCAAGRGGAAPPRAARLPALAHRGRPRRGAVDRRAVAGRDLRGRRGARRRREGRVQRPVSHVPRPAQRPARRLAAGQPRARLRDPPPDRGRQRPGRVPHERRRPAPPRRARAHPPGRHRQARGSVARRPGDRGRCRAAPAPVRVGLAQGRAQHGQQADRRGDPWRRHARRPRGRRAARAGARAAGLRIDAIDAELAATEQQLEDLLLRIPNPADPEVPVGGEEANVTVRTWGEPGVARGDRRGRHRLDAPPALGAGRGAGDDRQRARREGRGLRVPGLHRRRQPAPAQPHQLVPRRPHHRARLHRGLAAGRRQHGARARDRPDPGQGRPDVRRHPRRAVPGPHGRGAGHQPAPRRDPRGGPAARPVRGLHARAGGARRGPPARTPGASSGSTSSTRSRWCCSRSRRTAPRRSSG